MNVCVAVTGSSLHRDQIAQSLMAHTQKRETAKIADDSTNLGVLARAVRGEMKIGRGVSAMNARKLQFLIHVFLMWLRHSTSCVGQSLGLPVDRVM